MQKIQAATIGTPRREIHVEPLKEPKRQPKEAPVKAPAKPRREKVPAPA